MVVSDSVGCLFSIPRIDCIQSASWNTTPFLYPHTTPECTESVAGVMVSIVAFQAVDPGSIPGPRNFFFFFLVGCGDVCECWACVDVGSRCGWVATEEKKRKEKKRKEKKIRFYRDLNSDSQDQNLMC
jgi:hypothetical protein